MSKQTKTETFLIDGEPTEVVYSEFVMKSIIDPEIEVNIERIGDGKRKFSPHELYDVAIQIDMHERKDRVFRAEFLAEEKGDESRGN